MSVRISRANKTIICPRGDSGLLQIRIVNVDLPERTYARFYVKRRDGTILFEKRSTISSQSTIVVPIEPADTLECYAEVYYWNCTIYQGMSLTDSGVVESNDTDPIIVDTLFYNNVLRNQSPYFIIEA